MDAPIPSMGRSGFAIVFVLGAPGAGKGTLSAHLAQEYDMLHYSLGDNLRTWMRGNCDTSLAAQIRDRLDNQGFLNAEELSPFLHGAVADAIRDNNRGVIVDGFPRCVEQLRSFDGWVTQDKLPIPQRGQTKVVARPDVVLLFEVTESNARSRYLRRGRDSNDSKEKFEKRFAEYQQETSLVEDEYQQRGILLRIDANGTRQENIAVLAEQLKTSNLWQKLRAEWNLEN